MARNLDFSLRTHSPAGSAVPPAAGQVEVIPGKGVPSKAGRLRESLRRVCHGSLFLGLSIVPLRRFRHDLSGRPSLGNSVVERARLYAGLVRQFCNVHSFPAKHDDPGRSHVSVVRTWGAPSAIVRAVALVVIDAIKSVSLRARRHVLNKIPERVAPSLAHLNTSSAVIPEGDVLGVMATLDHLSPRPVQRVFGLWHSWIVSPVVTGGNNAV